MRIAEKTLILPALYIIDRNGTATTSELITELTSVFNPVGDDAKILDGRNDTRFSQKVRNLKSHRDNNGMAEYTEYKNSKYSLKEKGLEYLQKNLSEIEYLFDNKFACDDVVAVVDAIINSQNKKKKVIVYSERDIVSEGATHKKESTVKKRSKKLRNAALEHYKKLNGNLCCTICGFSFEKFYGDIGEDFIEMHHEEAIYQYSDEGFESYIYEAIQKMKPVCSNCHSMIHRNPKQPLTIEELKNVIK